MSSLADRLNHLFDTVHPAGRGPFTLAEVVQAIKAKDSGVSISIGYLSELRTGRTTDPKMSHLEALSDFFGVQPAYFFDDAYAAKTDADLEDLTLLRDSGVRSVARRAFELPADARQSLDDLLTALGRTKRQRGDGQSDGGTD